MFEKVAHFTPSEDESFKIEHNLLTGEKKVFANELVVAHHKRNLFDHYTTIPIPGSGYAIKVIPHLLAFRYELTTSDSLDEPLLSSFADI
tara:strand:+ start:437 stop:706 length:270 start_codon:yes stop_codon:yes gene_type:complete